MTKDEITQEIKNHFDINPIFAHHVARHAESWRVLKSIE